jgi:hypothetical protein
MDWWTLWTLVTLVVILFWRVIRLEGEVETLRKAVRELCTALDEFGKGVVRVVGEPDLRNRPCLPPMETITSASRYSPEQRAAWKRTGP